MISVRVQKALGGFRLDVDFEAPAGVTVLFGKSGSGKTSVVNAVAGLLRPDAGRIAVGARVLFDSGAGIDRPVHRRHVGYVFQDARLFPHLTVAGNLRYGGDTDAEKVIALLGLEGLLTRRPAALSGGERQRVALGRALMSNPAILLMDEPLAALDADRKALILPYLERLRDEFALPILYVTHDVAEAARLGSTMVLLDNGRVARSGPLGEVLADPAAGRTLSQRDAGAVLPGRVEGAEDEDGLVRVSTPAGDLVLPGQGMLPGTLLRLRIPAQDIMLSDRRPEGLSALNVLPARVLSVTGAEAGRVDIELAAGEARLLARLTRRSARRLDLRPGAQVHAVVKATAIGPGL